MAVNRRLAFNNKPLTLEQYEGGANREAMLTDLRSQWAIPTPPSGKEVDRATTELVALQAEYDQVLATLDGEDTRAAAKVAPRARELPRLLRDAELRVIQATEKRTEPYLAALEDALAAHEPDVVALRDHIKRLQVDLDVTTALWTELNRIHEFARFQLSQCRTKRADADVVEVAEARRTLSHA